MQTFSRYDFMSDSSVADEVTHSYYPDPLSLNYLNLALTTVPIKDTMTDPKIICFWNEAASIYNIMGYDDIVLTVNGISHKNFLNPGDTIYFPSYEDINNSYRK